MDTPFELNSNTTTQSSSVTSAGHNFTVPAGAQTARIYNAGPDAAYLKGGIAGVAADNTDLRFPAGLVEVLGVSGAKEISAKSAGTSDLSISFGWGA
jgi:hypothetical protein